MMKLLTVALLLGANVFEDTWHGANRAYEAGDFSAAVQGYEDLAESNVVDAALFYNLGNAYYRLGEYGAAIANYERALQLDPDLERARENLSQTLRQTERNLARPLAPEWQQSLLFWHEGLRPGTSWGLAVFAWCVFWLLLAVRQWRRIRFLRLAAAVAFLLTLLFACSAWVKTHPPALAVATADRVPVRFGTSTDETVRFELYEGDRVLIDDAQNGWVRVMTISGDRGWAREDALLRVGPPYQSFRSTTRGSADAERSS